MRDIFNTIISFWMGFILCCLITEKTDLEIYTKDNIYYIEGLTVTNEADASEKTFKTKEELKEYISNITAKENEPGTN